MPMSRTRSRKRVFQISRPILVADLVKFRRASGYSPSKARICAGTSLRRISTLKSFAPSLLSAMKDSIES